MIYCVRFADIVAHLNGLGFRLVDQTEATVAFALGPDRLVIRGPNVHGHLPEMVVNDAFDAAELTPPP